MLGYILLIVAILLAVFLGCLVHAGFFYTLRIRTSIPCSIPTRVAYKVYRGPYKNAGAGFSDIEQVAPSLKKFGLYYDDPNKVPQSDLRYIIGCCLPENSSVASSNSDSGGGKRQPQEVEERLSSNGYSVWSFSKCTNAVITEFPYRSMLSVLVAPFCVYPALGRYFKKQGLADSVGPIFEVCENDCIRYIATLTDKEGFFVPEVAMETEAKKSQ